MLKTNFTYSSYSTDLDIQKPQLTSNDVKIIKENNISILTQTSNGYIFSTSNGYIFKYPNQTGKNLNEVIKDIINCRNFVNIFKTQNLSEKNLISNIKGLCSLYISEQEKINIASKINKLNNKLLLELKQRGINLNQLSLIPTMDILQSSIINYEETLNYLSIF